MALSQLAELVRDTQGYAIFACIHTIGKHLIHSPAGWVDDKERAVVFIRREAAAMTQCRLANEGCDKITDLRIERIP